MEESSVAILAQASHLHSSIPYSHSYLLQDHQGNMSAFMRRQMGSSPVMSTMSSGGYGTGYGTSYGTGYGTTRMSSPQYMQQAPVQTMAAPQYMQQARVQTMAAPQMMVQQAPMQTMAAPQYIQQASVQTMAAPQMMVQQAPMQRSEG